MTISFPHLLCYSHGCLDGFSSAGQIPSASVPLLLPCRLFAECLGCWQEAGSIPGHRAEHMHPCQGTMHHSTCILSFGCLILWHLLKYKQGGAVLERFGMLGQMDASLEGRPWELTQMDWICSHFSFTKVRVRFSWHQTPSLLLPPKTGTTRKPVPIVKRTSIPQKPFF